MRNDPNYDCDRRRRCPEEPARAARTKDQGPKDQGPKDQGPKDQGPKDQGPKDQGR